MTMGKNKKDRLCANPMMAYKKEQKKKEIKKSKKQTVVRREAQTMLRDPAAVSAEIERLVEEANSNRADLDVRRKLAALRSHQAVLEKSLRADEKRPAAELGYAGAPAASAAASPSP